MVSKIEYYQGKTHRGTEAVSKDKHWGQPDEDGQYNEGRAQGCSHAKDRSVTVGALKINRQKFFSGDKWLKDDTDLFQHPNFPLN